MKERTIDWWETAFLIIYGVILLHDFLDTTMFPIVWPSRIGYLFFAAVIVYVLAKLIWHNDYTKKERVLLAVILAAFSIPAFTTEYSFLLEIGFLIVGAKDVRLDRILKVYLVIGFTVMLAAFLASQMGWIENLVYYAGEERKFRNSFGIIYPTDFAAHVFYLILAASVIGNRITTVPDILLVLFFALFVWKACGARTAFVCIGIYALLLAAEKWRRLTVKKGKSPCRKWKILLGLVPALCGVIFIAMASLYRETEGSWLKLNALFSNRLQLSAEGISEYGYSLFGQNINEIGNGGTLEYNYAYFFLDDSYIRIALKYGVVLLVVVLLVLTLVIWKSFHMGRVLIAAAVIMIAVHSTMEHHLLEIAYNPFLLGLFADWSYDPDKRKKSLFLISLDGYEI